MHWFQHRSGTLPTVSFADAAARQTGIYAGVGALRGDRLEAAVGACCGALCLRTPVWEPAAGLVAEGGPGGGAVPCREPCSVFVSFAREVLGEGARGDAAGCDAGAGSG